MAAAMELGIPLSTVETWSSREDWHIPNPRVKARKRWADRMGDLADEIGDHVAAALVRYAEAVQAGDSKAAAEYAKSVSSQGLGMFAQLLAGEATQRGETAAVIATWTPEQRAKKRRELEETGRARLGLPAQSVISANNRTDIHTDQALPTAADSSPDQTASE